jgi:hypothetical protein
MMSDHADRSASVPVGSPEQLIVRLTFLADLINTRMVTARASDDSARPSFEVDMPTRELSAVVDVLKEAALALRVPEPSATAASKQVRRQLVTIMDQNGSEPALAVRRMMSEVITPLVLRLAAAPPVVGGWQAIESAPKRHHDVIDLWCVGEHDDIAFYCANYCATGRYINGYHEYQGRVPNVWWRDGAWRPKSKLRLHAITVAPTHWMPLPEPPK